MPKKVRAIYMNVRFIARIVLVTLILGWLTSAVVAAGFALLQYQEIVRYFPADQVAAQFQTHLDRELWRGSLLLFVRIGVVGGALWWQLTRQPVLPRYGLLCGLLVGVVEAAVGWWWQVPRLLLVPLVISLIMIGWLASTYQSQPTDSP